MVGQQPARAGRAPTRSAAWAGGADAVAALLEPEVAAAERAAGGRPAQSRWLPPLAPTTEPLEPSAPPAPPEPPASTVQGAPQPEPVPPPPQQQQQLAEAAASLEPPSASQPVDQRSTGLSVVQVAVEGYSDDSAGRTLYHIKATVADCTGLHATAAPAVRVYTTRHRFSDFLLLHTSIGGGVEFPVSKRFWHPQRVLLSRQLQLEEYLQAELAGRNSALPPALLAFFGVPLGAGGPTLDAKAERDLFETGGRGCSEQLCVVQ